jgi:hypothetical protein
LARNGLAGSPSSSTLGGHRVQRPADRDDAGPISQRSSKRHSDAYPPNQAASLPDRSSARVYVRLPSTLTDRQMFSSGVVLLPDSVAEPDIVASLAARRAGQAT